MVEFVQPHNLTNGVALNILYNKITSAFPTFQMTDNTQTYLFSNIKKGI